MKNLFAPVRPAWQQVFLAAWTLTPAALLLASSLAAFLVFPFPPSSATAQGKDSDAQVAKRLGLSRAELQQLHDGFGMTNEMLLALPPKKMHMWYRKLARGNIQRDRAAFASLSLKNDKGLIPEGAQLLAHEQLKNLFKKIREEDLIAGLPVGPQVDQRNLLPPRAQANVKTAGWEELGPDRVGGRTRTLLIDPSDPSIMYAGSASGGVWKTTDGGANWDPLSDLQLANMAVCAMVMHPRDPGILYVGTGEGFNNLDAVRGSGIYKTENAGKTWKLLSLPDKHKDVFQFVNRLAISPDGKVLLAAVGAILDEKDPHYKSVRENSGIYRSADPKHGDWQLVQKGLFGCVAFDPKDSSKAIAGSLSRAPEDQGQAFYSTTGGESWETAIDFWVHNSRSVRTELAYALADPKIVYASVDINFDREGKYSGELWRSVNGGRSYKRVPAKHRKGGGGFGYYLSAGWYANVVWAGHPTDSNLVLLGGLDLWKSTNGGKTFEAISDWTSPESSAHADQHVIVGHPEFGKKNNAVYFGNDGGIFRADDLSTLERNKGWTPLSNRYVVTQFYGAAGHAKSGIIIAGAQDNGTLKLVNLDKKDERWEVVYGGDGGYCAIDQDDPRYMYGEYIHGAIFRADPEGNVQLFGFREDPDKHGRLTRRPAPYNIPDASNPESANESRNANFIAPFILDPNDQKRLLAGGASLWVTHNARADVPKWESMRGPVSKTNYISAIAVAKGNSNVIWVGYNGGYNGAEGEIYMTTNGLSPDRKWKRVDDGKVVLPNRSVTRIVIDPKNPKHVYVTFAGYTKGNLWVTEDAGETWKDLSKGLPEVPYHTLAIHPRNARFLYLGTDLGVLTSGNGGESWGPTNQAAIGCRVDELFWMEETLVAATHGRGIFRTNLSKAVPKD